MNTITISVCGEELEVINVELTSEEVTALYKLRKEQALKIADLEKKVADSASSLKHANERNDAAQAELSQANVLLTALGVQEKTNEEETYYRKPLQVATRIALYIAGSSKP